MRILRIATKEVLDGRNATLRPPGTRGRIMGIYDHRIPP